MSLPYGIRMREAYKFMASGGVEGLNSNDWHGSLSDERIGRADETFRKEARPAARDVAEAFDAHRHGRLEKSDFFTSRQSETLEHLLSTGAIDSMAACNYFRVRVHLKEGRLIDVYSGQSG